MVQTANDSNGHIPDRTPWRPFRRRDTTVGNESNSEPVAQTDADQIQVGEPCSTHRAPQTRRSTNELARPTETYQGVVQHLANSVFVRSVVSVAHWFGALSFQTAGANANELDHHYALSSGTSQPPASTPSSSSDDDRDEPSGKHQIQDTASSMANASRTYDTISTARAAATDLDDIIHSLLQPQALGQSPLTRSSSTNSMLSEQTDSTQDEREENEQDGGELGEELAVGQTGATPEPLAKYYKMSGRLENLALRIRNMEVDHQRAASRREQLEDQGEVLDISDEEFERRFQERHSRLMARHSVLTHDVDELMIENAQQGYHIQLERDDKEESVMHLLPQATVVEAILQELLTIHDTEPLPDDLILPEGLKVEHITHDRWTSDSPPPDDGDDNGEAVAAWLAMHQSGSRSSSSSSISSLGNAEPSLSSSIGPDSRLWLPDSSYSPRLDR